MNFVFITDTHFLLTSKVRTGDVLSDLATKLTFVRDYCNTNNCALLHSGDFFNTPSVPDIVKNTIFPILRSFKNPIYTIFGNHDLLYGSEEFLDKTSYKTLVTTDLVTPIDNATIDLGSCFLTNELPLITRGKPTICLYHGFLNSDDKWSLKFQDINTTDHTYILLGHDHCPYPPLAFSNNVKIFRPGSFLRQTRNEEHLRIPELLHIRINEGKLQYKSVPISTARPASEVFLAKEAAISKAAQHESYENIIAQIRSASSSQLTFSEALNQVTAPEVSEYITKLLTNYRMNNSVKRQNL